MTLFYLASKSPRRAQILRDIGFHDFTVLSDKTVPTAFAGDEVRLAGESPENYVSRTAREKALRAFNRIEKEGLAAIYIDHIDGSFSGIMGLPAYQTAALLKTLGIEPSEN